MTAKNQVHIIHENEEWIAPLVEQLQNQGIPYAEWFLEQGTIALNSEPPKGIFYNKISASSHTRGHHQAAALAETTISWLEQHNRRVVNGSNALFMEMRKTEQYFRLNKFDINVPRTIAASGKKEIIAAATDFGSNFIIKPNRGAKGTGVSLFQTVGGLELFLESNSIESVDGVVLVQDYIKPREGYVVRLEFIGGKFYYALKVDTSGGFELCPADGCQIDAEFCPTTDSPKFEIIKDFHIPEISRIEAFMANNGIDIAAAEFVEGEDGQRFFYDINVNTNYNAEAEARNGNKLQGMREIATFLGKQLQLLSPPADLIAG